MFAKRSNLLSKSSFCFILTFLLLPAFFVLHSQEIDTSEMTKIQAPESRRKSFLYVRATPLLIPGGAIGYTHRIRLIDEGVIDFTIAAHYHALGKAHRSYGLSLVTEHFGNARAQGFFFRANFGAEYAEMQDTFDDDPEWKKRWFPNITIGLGYSIPIFGTSYIRFSAELGYTMLLGRINCEFLF